MRESQGHFSYNAAKGATVHLAKLMSTEFEKVKVRVNSIAPGYFPSEMTMAESNEDQKTHMPHEKIEEKGHVPADRPGSDEEMAQAVLFLAKNAYCNGEIMYVILYFPLLSLVEWIIKHISGALYYQSFFTDSSLILTG